jgi:hypothetical protein
VLPRRVFRKMTIDGLVTPAFIHNGSFFLVDLPVYADGLVDCWEMVDLPLFREKLRTGWVTPTARDGAEISVHGLGRWTATGGTWDLNADSLYAHVQALLAALNPRMENLHDCHGRTVERRGKVNVSILGMPKKHALRLIGPDSALPARVEGDTLSAIVTSGAEYYVARLSVFADGVIEIGSIPSPEVLDMEGLDRAVSSGRLLGRVPRGTRLRIQGLGSFVVDREHWCAAPREQVREVSDLLDNVKGREDSIARCRDAYDEYIADPTQARRETLRLAYEAVPQHNRSYVGDMDTKDIAVRMILYGEQEVERWSHRRVARARGEPVLPTITIPKPKD